MASMGMKVRESAGDRVFLAFIYTILILLLIVSVSAYLYPQQLDQQPRCGYLRQSLALAG